MPQMIIASRLSDGRAAFLVAAGRWSVDIDEGVLLEDEAAAERWLAVARDDEARDVVVDPYLVEVSVEEGRRAPLAVREAIRAFGPTVRTDQPSAADA